MNLHEGSILLNDGGGKGCHGSERRFENENVEKMRECSGPLGAARINVQMESGSDTPVQCI